MLMSCPVLALVAGVKMGRGRRSDSRRPAGSGTPQTAPLVWYSFQPDPDRYPRATHSMASGCVLRTSIDRPWSISRCGWNAAGRSLMSVDSRWLGTRPAVWPNQNAESWVRTLPLSGMPEPRT
jgi:hypothetical protein